MLSTRLQHLQHKVLVQTVSHTVPFHATHNSNAAQLCLQANEKGSSVGKEAVMAVEGIIALHSHPKIHCQRNQGHISYTCASPRIKPEWKSLPTLWECP